MLSSNETCLSNTTLGFEVPANPNAKLPFFPGMAMCKSQLKFIPKNALDGVKTLGLTRIFTLSPSQDFRNWIQNLRYVVRIWEAAYEDLMHVRLRWAPINGQTLP